LHQCDAEFTQQLARNRALTSNGYKSGKPMIMTDFVVEVPMDRRFAFGEKIASGRNALLNLLEHQSCIYCVNSN
jgi:hypothetical protein